MIASLFLALLGLPTAFSATDFACRPFRVHLHAQEDDSIPKPPPSEKARRHLASCIAYYENLDQNNNGKKDWSSRSDGRISDILFPADDDIDGDGISNILDPKPMKAEPTSQSAPENGLPNHLKMRGIRLKLQSDLFTRFRIIAIDHSDQHAEAVLQAFDQVLSHGLSPKARDGLKSVKVIYAFAGHDPVHNIAAYHRSIQAISIGGEMSYGSSSLSALSRERRVALLAAIAHEFGHAVLFDQISAEELGEAGRRFGKWTPIIGQGKVTDLLTDSRLFLAHPLRTLAALIQPSRGRTTDLTQLGIWRDSNIVSAYSTTNIHEWFADAFAARVLHRLGERGLLGNNWQPLLAYTLDEGKGYWVNYNNLSVSFREWIDERIFSQNKSRVSGLDHPLAPYRPRRSERK